MPAAWGKRCLAIGSFHMAAHRIAFRHARHTLAAKPLELEYD